MLNRRRFAQWMSGLFAVSKWKMLGAATSPPPFLAGQGEVLRKVALIVLPSELSAEQRIQVAARFERYVREYRPGADTEHGYGITRVHPKPSSPETTYIQQLQSLSSEVTAESITRMIEDSRIEELPQTPTGKNVVIDLISFYFRSSDANDLCYRAEIGRDKCRGLAGSAKAPAAMKGLG